jgi:hypothetical protein
MTPDHVIAVPSIICKHCLRLCDVRLPHLILREAKEVCVTAICPSPTCRYSYLIHLLLVPAVRTDLP